MLRPLFCVGDTERHAGGETKQRADVLRGFLCLDLSAKLFQIFVVVVEDVLGMHQRLGDLTERAIGRNRVSVSAGPFMLRGRAAAVGVEVSHEEFPELVDASGIGWLVRHVRRMCAFAKKHPDVVSKPDASACEKLSNGWEDEWRKKVVQMQVPIFAPSTQAAWGLRFDDVLADALELGPLCSPDISFSSELEQRIEDSTPKGVPTESVVFYRVDDPLATRSIYLSYAKRGMTDVRRQLIEFMENRCLLDCAQSGTIL